MTVTAHSSVVNMPPGHYDKIAQVIRGKINTGGWGRSGGSGKPPRPYKRTRAGVYNRSQKGLWIKRYLDEAALLDPDERGELWIR